MTLFNINSKLCDIIFYDSSVISVINRFGINLGVGDYTVAEICRSHNLDENFLIVIINTFLNEKYFPERLLKTYSITKIVNYLEKTNSYYEQFQLPNIERHFNLLIMKSNADDGNLHLLKRFFDEMKNELLLRINFDRQEWFPQLLQLGNTTLDEDIELDNIPESAHPIEDKLNDLKSFFIIHLKGKYDVNLCQAVVSSIIALEKDLKQNNRIRESILLPFERALTK